MSEHDDTERGWLEGRDSRTAQDRINEPDECPTRSGRGDWMDEPCSDCAPTIPASMRTEWRGDSRPTNHGSAREAILNRRIIQLLDALECALHEDRDEGRAS